MWAHPYILFERAVLMHKKSVVSWSAWNLQNGHYQWSCWDNQNGGDGACCCDMCCIVLGRRRCRCRCFWCTHSRSRRRHSRNWRWCSFRCHYALVVFSGVEHCVDAMDSHLPIGVEVGVCNPCIVKFKSALDDASDHYIHTRRSCWDCSI